jgi:methane monooxygenase component A alpha chain/propane monooxygenase large subunit
MSILETSDRNVELLQDDIIQCAWREFVSFTLPTALVYEYGATTRPKRSFKMLWEEWVLEQFYGSYMSKLEKFGITIPDDLITDLKYWITWAPHTLGVFAKMVWPFMWFRQDPLGPADYEYFEHHYPGWFERFGLIHGLADETSVRGNGALVTYEGIQILGKDLQLCQVCHLPTILPEALTDADNYRIFVKDGERTLSFCSKWCKWIFDRAPQRYQAPQFFEHYNGQGWGDIIRDQNLLRPDGRLLGQPRLDTLDTDQMWTIDDIDNFGLTFDLLRP